MVSIRNANFNDILAAKRFAEGRNTLAKDEAAASAERDGNNLGRQPVIP